MPTWQSCTKHMIKMLSGVIILSSGAGRRRLAGRHARIVTSAHVSCVRARWEWCRAVRERVSRGASGRATRDVMFRRRALRRRLAAAGAGSLPDDQLRRLARALDAGAAGIECVPPQPHHAAQLRLAVVRAYRFSDLNDLSELRRLPVCTEQHCCNPYHWSRLCKPGMWSRWDATSALNAA